MLEQLKYLLLSKTSIGEGIQSIQKHFQTLQHYQTLSTFFNFNYEYIDSLHFDNLYKPFMHDWNKNNNDIFSLTCLYVGTVFFYFFFRKWCIKYLKFFYEYEETISRIFSSLFQLFIVFILLWSGPILSVHAFLSYLFCDIVYSFVYGPKLDTIIYIHHIIGAFISFIGLKGFTRSITDNNFKNTYVISGYLLAMEISAPILSAQWILKRENIFYCIKHWELYLYIPLAILYGLFRLYFPILLFIQLVFYLRWKEYFYFYALVLFCLSALILLQIYWLIKLLQSLNKKMFLKKNN